jgi:polyisoprenoid-binding protein YceI
MGKSLCAVAAALFLAGTLPAPAAVPPAATGRWNVDKVHSEVGFQIRHLMSRVRGHFDEFEGTISIDAAKPEASSVTFTIRAASIDTKEPKRDADLRSPNFFDAEKNPEIRFVSRKVVPVSDTKYEVTGDLTMHGVTRQVTLPVNFLGLARDPWGHERAGFEVDLTLNRKDYGINWNKALDQGGTLVGDEVAVSINIEAVKAKAASAAK